MVVQLSSMISFQKGRRQRFADIVAQKKKKRLQTKDSPVPAAQPRQPTRDDRNDGNVSSRRESRSDSGGREQAAATSSPREKNQDDKTKATSVTPIQVMETSDSASTGSSKGLSPRRPKRQESSSSSRVSSSSPRDRILKSKIPAPSSHRRGDGSSKVPVSTSREKGNKPPEPSSSRGSKRNGKSNDELTPHELKMKISALQNRIKRKTSSKRTSSADTRQNQHSQQQQEPQKQTEEANPQTDTSSESSADKGKKAIERFQARVARKRNSILPTDEEKGHKDLDQSLDEIAMQIKSGESQDTLNAMPELEQRKANLPRFPSYLTVATEATDETEMSDEVDVAGLVAPPRRNANVSRALQLTPRAATRPLRELVEEQERALAARLAEDAIMAEEEKHTAAWSFGLCCFGGSNNNTTRSSPAAKDYEAKYVARERNVYLKPTSRELQQREVVPLPKALIQNDHDLETDSHKEDDMEAAEDIEEEEEEDSSVVSAEAVASRDSFDDVAENQSISSPADVASIASIAQDGTEDDRSGGSVRDMASLASFGENTCNWCGNSNTVVDQVEETTSLDTANEKISGGCCLRHAGDEKDDLLEAISEDREAEEYEARDENEEHDGNQDHASATKYFNHVTADEDSWDSEDEEELPQDDSYPSIGVGSNGMNRSTSMNGMQGKVAFSQEDMQASGEKMHQGWLVMPEQNKAFPLVFSFGSLASLDG